MNRHTALATTSAGGRPGALAQRAGRDAAADQPGREGEAHWNNARWTAPYKEALGTVDATNGAALGDDLQSIV